MIETASEELRSKAPLAAFTSLSSLLRRFFFAPPPLNSFFSYLSPPPLAENGAPAADGAAADASYVLPEKWSEDIVDEKGEKMSKT